MAQNDEVVVKAIVPGERWDCSVCDDGTAAEYQVLSELPEAWGYCEAHVGVGVASVMAEANDALDESVSNAKYEERVLGIKDECRCVGFCHCEVK